MTTKKFTLGRTPREATSQRGRQQETETAHVGPFRGSPRTRDDENLPPPCELKSATADPRGTDRANRKGDLDTAALWSILRGK